MRVIITGASNFAVVTAEKLLERGHDVVIVEQDEEQIEALAERMDCGFVVGAGGRPAVLEEIGPGESDLLLAVSDDDHDNIIASAIGRTLGFGRVITKIEDVDFEPVCAKLGLENVIVPDRQIAQQLADMVEGRFINELAAVLQGNLRFFPFAVDDSLAGAIAELDLPADARIVAWSRDGESRLPAEDDVLEPGDSVVLITVEERLGDLEARFADDDAGD